MKKILALTFVLFAFTSILQARPYCKNMSSCAEACKYLSEGYTSLDRDRDGIPCENICDEPCKVKSKKTKNAKKTKKSK